MEWQTCNRVCKKKGKVGSHIFYLEMQEAKLDKLSLLDLWKEGFPKIDPFNYPNSYIREVHPDEEVDTL